MDSFYDAPRRPPPPIARERLASIPVVPEISVLCSSNTPKNAFTPYNQWKEQQNTAQNNKENMGQFTMQPQNSSILKKQVRFESPVNQHKNQIISNQNIAKTNPNNIQTNAPPSFEQLYMANIPNRKLDLSVIAIPTRATKIVKNVKLEQPNINKEPPNMKETTLQTPKTYKEFLESQKKPVIVIQNDSVTDIFNYRPMETVDDALKDLKANPIQVVHKTESPSNTQANYFQQVSQAISQRSLTNHPKMEPSLKQPTQQIFTPNNNYTEYMKNPNNYYNQTDHRINEVFSKEYSSHYKSNPIICNQETVNKTCHCCTDGCNNKESSALKLKSDDDFTTKDLLKIIAQQSQQIAQQNTQLLMLQQQISDLVSLQKDQQKTIDQDVHCCQHVKDKIQNVLGENMEALQERCITSTQHDIGQTSTATPRKSKNHLPNFSIGMTTSFEVSFRPPARNHQPHEFIQRNNKLLDYQPEGPKIQEVTETDSLGTDRVYTHVENKDTLMDGSLVLKEPIKVREMCPSPDPSIKIDMNDFEESDSNDDGETSEIEPNFYKNLMTQVNKILQKAQIETADQLANNVKGTNLSNKTMRKVTETTMKHLRRIGVDLPSFEDSLPNSSFSDDTAEKVYDQDDISFAVKQLLMKYLPAEHLSKLASKERNQGGQIGTPKKKVGAIKNRPDFSFATVQYMKKYNLITSGNNKDCNQSPKQHPLQSPKILDISKLKQQPKLL